MASSDAIASSDTRHPECNIFDYWMRIGFPLVLRLTLNAIHDCGSGAGLGFLGYRNAIWNLSCHVGDGRTSGRLAFT